ncbi:MAG TPA: FtsW/RodA/SpoVE family cell cycle protein, partial [Gammaproteobacteria bacterium]|nr:FtsW/RodA/SpoVE family cell cycle protein [Gammaproteobacteria bacterium]
MAVSPSVFGDRHSLSLGRQIMTRLRLDAPLLVGLLLICGFGLVVLWSAGGQDTGLLLRQVVRLGVAFGVLLAVAQVPPKLLRLWSPWLFLGGLLLLVAVLVAGDVGKGAQRWLDLGIVRFQPSEIMKLAVPMMAAWYLHDRPLPPRLVELVVVLALVVTPALLIARQPDLGTALLVGSAGLLVVLLGGLRLRLIVLLGAATAALAPVLWHFMHDYQRRRVLTLFNPES